MRGQAVLFMLAASAVGCGPRVEDPEPEVRFRTCGEDGPVRLLSAEGGSRAFLIRLHEDRLLVTSYEREGDGSVSWASSETRLVDPCGGNERRIAEGHYLDVIAGELVACNDDGDILWLDPDDGYAPTTLFENVDCEVATTPHGWVAKRASDGVVLIRRTLSAEGAPEVLPTTAQWLPWACHIRANTCDPEAPTLRGSAMYVLDADDQIVRVELEGVSSTEVVGEATWARQSADARWLFWADAGETMHVRDLETGEDTVLYDGQPPLFTLLPHHLALLRSTPPRLFDLGHGNTFELPAGIDGIATRPGDHTLLFDPEMSYVWDDQRLDLRPLGPPDSYCPREWLREGYARTDCEQGGDTLWLTPYDGSEPQRIATGVDSSNFMIVPSGVVWSTNERPIAPGISPESLLQAGELRLGEDPDASILLDRNAYLHPFLTIDGDVFYATFDDDEPATLWRTALE